jgi:PDZ domain-containing protein
LFRQDDDPARLTRGNKAVLALFFATLAILVLGSLVHLPYAIMSPGPITNTLGDQTIDGKSQPLITIDDLPTYPTEGSLDFTTVRVDGGPGFPVDAWDLLQAWIDPTRDVLPVDEVYDPTVTEEEVAEENAVLMAGSQEEATAVALRATGADVPAHIVVSDITDSSKAAGILKKGDRIESIDGQAVTDSQSVRDALQRVEPGAEVTMEVERGGKTETLQVPTIEGQKGRTALGILLGLDHDFPATVKINAGHVGGPSAGLMFALGIYDKLTPGPLTGDKDIAGTGTIADDGSVGPIGGIKQKLAGARAGGADYFLAPADNCSEVVGNIPDGLAVFKVTSFDDARTAVQAIAEDRTGSLPRC